MCCSHIIETLLKIAKKTKLSELAAEGKTHFTNSRYLASLSPRQLSEGGPWVRNHWLTPSYFIGALSGKIKFSGGAVSDILAQKSWRPGLFKITLPYLSLPT